MSPLGPNSSLDSGQQSANQCGPLGIPIFLEPPLNLSDPLGAHVFVKTDNRRPRGRGTRAHDHQRTWTEKQPRAFWSARDTRTLQSYGDLWTDEYYLFNLLYRLTQTPTSKPELNHIIPSTKPHLTPIHTFMPLNGVVYTQKITIKLTQPKSLHCIS